MLAGSGEKIKRDHDNRSHTVYFGIYEYDTADGQHISSASEFCYYDPRAIPGAQDKMVKLRYNPNHPSEFALEEEQAVSISVWPAFRKTGILLTVIGVLLSAAAAAALLGFFDPLIDSLMS